MNGQIQSIADGRKVSSSTALVFLLVILFILSLSKMKRSQNKIRKSRYFNLNWKTASQEKRN